MITAQSISKGYPPPQEVTLQRSACVLLFFFFFSSHGPYLQALIPRTTLHFGVPQSNGLLYLFLP